MIEKYLGKCSCVQKNLWEVDLLGKKINAQLNNKFKSKRLPVVGDNVVIIQDEWENFLIDEVVQSKNELFRMNKGEKQVLASNVDIIFIVSSMNNEFNIAKIERLAILANIPNAKKCIILTKKDACTAPDTFIAVTQNRFPNTPVIATNAFKKEGLDEIKNFWKPNESAIFVGSSGVGKSTLVNALADKEVMKTGEIRDKDSKGRHTTTTRNLFVLNDHRIVIDTPGIRSVGVSNEKNVEGIQDVFSTIIKLEKQCKYYDCSHTHENGCAVKQAIQQGLITQQEVLRYQKFKRKEKSKKAIMQEENSLPKWQKMQKTKDRKISSKNQREQRNFR